MGLDITVNTTGAEVLAALECNDPGVKHPETVRALLAGASIHTRPGSYAGLHHLRAAYIKLKGLDPEPEPGDKDKSIPKSHEGYHLLYHCDSSGWYLPEKELDCNWLGEVSIGSSWHLLQELEELELERANVPDEFNWGAAWDAVYLAAAASVLTGTPMRFR